MSKKIKDIIEQIKFLENELKEEIVKEESKIHYYTKGKRIYFDKETIKKQKDVLEDIITYIKNAPLLYILTAPIIYGLIIPAIFLDICVWIYQKINFKVYNIKPIKRSDYIVFDRQYLNYLNTIEKVNCMYCSYFNGLMAYVSEVAAATEQFWCPIKHAKKIAYRHSRYDNFFAYGDHESYRKKLLELRKQLSKE